MTTTTLPATCPLYLVDATHYVFVQIQTKEGLEWQPQARRWQGIVTAQNEEEALRYSSPGGGTRGATLIKHSVCRIGTAEGEEGPWQGLSTAPYPGGLVLLYRNDYSFPWKEQ